LRQTDSEDGLSASVGSRYSSARRNPSEHRYLRTWTAIRNARSQVTVRLRLRPDHLLVEVEVEDEDSRLPVLQQHNDGDALGGCGLMPCRREDLDRSKVLDRRVGPTSRSRQG
jgi:hypothetical protein